MLVIPGISPFDVAAACYNIHACQELISQGKIRLHDLEPIRTIQWDIFSDCVFLRYVLASNDTV